MSRRVVNKYCKSNMRIFLLIGLFQLYSVKIKVNHLFQNITMNARDFYQYFYLSHRVLLINFKN